MSVSWHFARTAKWIVRHVAVVALVAAMLWAGSWQLRRLDDKRDHRDLVEARQDQPVAPVTEVVPPDAAVDAGAVEDVLYRSVSATGTYLDDDTVVVENRTFNGAPGGWVLTPLAIDDSTAVVVNRGFVGFDQDGRVVAPPAPGGEVTVQGLVLPSQERGRIGPVDPSGVKLDVMARADIGRLDQQVQPDLLGAYVQLVASDPPEEAAATGAAALVPLGPPEVDLGPHLGYAVQWFIFSAIAAGGYVLLLRRVARDRAREGALRTAERDLDSELEELLGSER